MEYLKTIGLENFRLFKDKTVFELAPITILTGINSSGKSSLIKALQLFKSSLRETGNLEKLSFLRGNHNLGNFSKAVHEDSEKKEMKFIFDFPVWGFTEKTLLELIYVVSDKEGEDGKLSFAKIYVENGEDLLRIDLHYQKKGEEVIRPAIFVNFPFMINHALKNLETGNWAKERKKKELTMLDPTYIQTPTDHTTSLFKEFFLQDDLWADQTWDMESHVLLGFDELKSKEQEEINNAIIDSWDTGLLSYKNDGFGEFSIQDHLEFGRSWIMDAIGVQRNFIKLFEEEENFKPKKLSILGEIVFKKMFQISILNGIKPFITKLKSTEHLSSIRANSERLYSNHSDTFGINELLREFSKLKFHQDSAITKFFNRNLQKFNLGEEIIVKRTQGIASEVFVKKNGKEHLLADLGFGYTQLLPILLKIVIIAKNSPFFVPVLEERPATIFLLEEPESNLHPSYQSKLAELIIEAASLFNIQFIVETHSEYLIRNLQYLTATKKIRPRDTKIYYFHQPGSEDFKEVPYRVIEIKEDGRLSNEFGEGFFDEIPRLLAFLYNTNFN